MGVWYPNTITAEEIICECPRAVLWITLWNSPLFSSFEQSSKRQQQILGQCLCHFPCCLPVWDVLPKLLCSAASCSLFQSLLKLRARFPPLQRLLSVTLAMQNNLEPSLTVFVGSPGGSASISPRFWSRGYILWSLAREEERGQASPGFCQTSQVDRNQVPGCIRHSDYQVFGARTMLLASAVVLIEVITNNHKNNRGFWTRDWLCEMSIMEYETPYSLWVLDLCSLLNRK